MKRLFAFAMVACVASSGTALAADVAPRQSAPPVYKAQPFTTFDWTGFYTGINAGYAWGRSSWSDPAVGAGSGRFNPSGGMLGGQIGYNWQLGRAVVGIESDIGWANLKGATGGTGGVCATDGGGQCQTQQSWLGTTRARVGYTFDRFLPYITGGVAYGNVQAVQPNGTSSASRAGWTVGGGLEYGFTRAWSAKVEYLHVDLGTATFMGSASATPTLSVPLTEHIVRAGLNYHW